jgi:hypothetical protein
VRYRNERIPEEAGEGAYKKEYVGADGKPTGVITEVAARPKYPAVAAKSSGVPCDGCPDGDNAERGDKQLWRRYCAKPDGSDPTYVDHWSGAAPSPTEGLCPPGTFQSHAASAFPVNTSTMRAYCMNFIGTNENNILILSTVFWFISVLGTLGLIMDQFFYANAGAYVRARVDAGINVAEAAVAGARAGATAGIQAAQAQQQVFNNNNVPINA